MPVGGPVDLSRYAIWQRVLDHLPDSSLESMARADYGMHVDEHLAALQEIARTGRVPREMGHVPWEVIEVLRWSDCEEHPDRSVPCLFSCLVLLGGQFDPHLRDYLDHAAASDVIIAVDRAHTLGPPWRGELMPFLADLFALLKADWPPSERVPLALACLLLSSLNQSPEPERETWRAAIRELQFGDPFLVLHPPAKDFWLFLYTDLKMSLWRHYLALCAADVAELEVSGQD